MIKDDCITTLRLRFLKFGGKGNVIQLWQGRKKWRLWKEAEEKELRDLGVDAETIEKLHIYN